MGIMDSAANGLRMRLENVGVRPTLAFAIGEVAYLPPRKIPSWVAPAAIPKSETTWLVSQYENQLRATPDGLACIALIQGLCNRIFGPHGESMFVGSYPEYSQERWQETGQEQNIPSVNAMLKAAMAASAEFTADFIDSDFYWDCDEWVSAEDAGPGNDESFAQAATTVLGASKAVALMGRRYFDTGRDGLGSYRREAVIDQDREFDDLSMVCNLIGPEGQTLEVFFIQSGSRLGFFDGGALMAEDLNDGSPILFAVDAVKEIYCALDPSLMDATSGWARIDPVPLAGKMQLGIQLHGDRAIGLEVTPEMVFTDVYRSRYYAMLYFLEELDSRLAET
ncbi:hypothetical protein J2Y41_004580 [Arthrobacter sp. 1088]|uniref:hypothetical protein n=1 Tax=Arthrobacter sp. 1088 TaxID=2817768 RepID=UPI00285CCB37|nr:hypothetical protein [Arthrobacter sp. 1088]MDR6688980.1 hypothetical protein [Arthrobacter sp. 1088]